MKSSNVYDIIIVGAGLAGLTAAHEACRRGRRVLLLEAGERPGGKVVTRRWKGIVYELGALFAFSKDWVPFTVDAGKLLSESYPIGVLHEGRVIKGHSVAGCLEAIGVGKREILSLHHLLECGGPQLERINEAGRAALEAFFQVIHPGRMEDYVPRRRRDSLVRYSTSHYEAGNEALIDGLVQSTGAEVRCGCLVDSLHPDEDGVTVHWSEASHGSERARAEWLILATPAPEACRLAKSSATVSGDFLRRVRYGSGIVVVLGISGPPLESYSYVVCPKGPVSTFFFHHQAGPRDSETRIVTAYLVGDEATSRLSQDDSTLAEIARSQLDALGIGAVGSHDVSFYDVLRWPALGPIIEAKAYRGFCTGWLRPFDRVVLAGDYTWWNEGQMPYGMEAAISSGRRAARMVTGNPLTAVTTTFQPDPLAVSTVTRLTNGGPQFLDHCRDGTIAFYGLVLKAEPDQELERYLVGEAEDGLWGYQQDYGVTSLDSALVMEGLLATGRHKELLAYSSERLVEEFFDSEEGGFRTVPIDRKGRAPYWDGIDCLATGFCGWLLQQIAPGRHAAVIEACRSYLERKQLISGCWPGKWLTSEAIPLFYAVRFLAPPRPELSPSCKRAGLWAQSRQSDDGSWKGSVIETAAAVLALRALEGPGAAIRKGCSWIRAQRREESWPGEPILQYWFEDEGQKTMFHTSDRGRITTAWARIALAEGDRGEERS